MLTLTNKRHWAKIAMPLLTLLCVTACNNELTAPVPSVSQAPATNQPTDFKGWMKLHENELTSARLAYQTAKAKHILPGQPFDRNAFDVDYRASLQDQGVEVKKLPNSPDVWNPTRQTTAEYLDAHQVKGALKQYILTLEQNLRKAADKLLQDHAKASQSVTNRAARSPADDQWGPSEEQTRIAAWQELDNSNEAASANPSISYPEKEAIWMVTGMVMSYLPEFINLTKQELGFGSAVSSMLDEQATQAALGLGRLLKRLFNVVVTVAIQAAVIIVATVAAIAVTITPYTQPLSPYVNAIYAAVVGRMIGGMYEAVSGNNYLCVFTGDGGRC